MVFIRPNDLHYYRKINNDDCQFFNLAFRTELAYDLFRFLGPSYEAERLLQPEIPPHVQLRPAERDAAKEMIQRCFVKSADTRALSVEVKKTIMDLFTRYFPVPRAETLSDMPEWLSTVCTKMQSRENFCRGLESLQELACRSHEHLCHLFQKHLGTTPVNYINDIRLGLRGKPSYVHGQGDHRCARRVRFQQPQPFLPPVQEEVRRFSQAVSAAARQIDGAVHLRMTVAPVRADS